MASKKKWVGRLGDRRQFHATVVFMNQGNGRFGPYCVTKLVTRSKQYLVYYGIISVNNKRYAEEGDELTFNATIFNHTTYKGVKQTVLSKVKGAREVETNGREEKQICSSVG